MNKLINIEVNENQEPCVSGRELHQFLEVKERYNDWFSRMTEYGFSEDIDFMSFTEKSVKPQGGRPATDHIIKLDMAKELAMIQRTEKGKEARQYFITVEKEYNSPEKIMARALQIAERELSTLKLENKIQQQQILELKPKADYTDRILQSKSLVTISQIAKDYGMSGVEMNKRLHKLGIQYKQSGQWLLYRQYQDKGYTHSETVEIKHSDGQTGITMNTKWTQKGRLFLYKLLKENEILPMIEKEIA